MKRHGSMNHIYRLIWSQVRSAWIAVSETTRGPSKVSRCKLIAAALSLSAVAVEAAPVGGEVVRGAADIAQSGVTTTITQATPNLSLNWQSFNIAAAETVTFVQPSAAAIAVNRILDPHGTQILGHLNANGQVYLINPNGVLFGRNAQVNVGGLVASTLDLNDASLAGNARAFSGDGAGSIVNQGTIIATNGGYVAMLGNRVSNQGTISAQLGTVALGAGSAATLTFNGNSLVRMQVDQSVLNSVADNGGLVRADGGVVLMNAGANDALLASVVNNTGVIEARTVENRDGTIVLVGGMDAGTVNVGGTLDASAPGGGHGGFIETSAAHVNVANDANITTAALLGLAGAWLIDPFDFTIAATGGNMTGATLSTSLVSGNVLIQSTSGTVGTAGDVNVNDVVAWSANRLTLNAQRNININANLNGSGSASLALEYGQGAVAAGNLSGTIVHAAVNLPAGNSFSTKLGSDGAVKNYTVLTSLGAAGSMTGTDLQGINLDVAANYALGDDIDASATATWNASAGFAPLATANQFTGTFDGLGHTISGLTIARSGTNNVGLFGTVSNLGVVKNVGLLGGSVVGYIAVGPLVGMSYGAVSASYATGTVQGGLFVGGLVGRNANGTIRNSHATGAVTASIQQVGGLVGRTDGPSVISGSYATGAVSGSVAGGLIGHHEAGGALSNSYATGAVQGSSTVGGLVGQNYGSVSLSYSAGAVSGSSSLGGLVGLNFGSIGTSYWDITSSGRATSAGGTGLTTVQMRTATNFAGFNFTTTPGASGNNWVMVDADGSLNNAAGAVGATRPMLASEYSATITNAHQLQLMAMAPAANYTLGANVNAATTALIAGISKDVWGSSGFVPIGSLANPFTGTFDGRSHVVSGLTINRAALADVGLFGVTDTGAAISNIGLVGGSVTGAAATGALVGNNGVGIPISNSYSTATVIGAAGTGGLVGTNTTGAISNSYATGNVTGAAGTGGLVGSNTSGAISTSFASGAVTGAAGTGGLIGSNTSGAVSDSYATGAVLSTGAGVGGLIGSSTSGSITNTYATGSVTSPGADVGGLLGSGTGVVSDSYWDIETSGQLASPGGGEGRSSVQLKQQITFNSWDFASTWTIYEGDTNPWLRSLMTPLTVTANSQSTTYSAAAYSGGNGVSYSTPVNGALAGTLVYGGTAQGAIDAGSYVIAPSGLQSNQQYLITFANGALTIDPAHLTVTAVNDNRLYGQVNPTLATTVSGFVNGQTAATAAGFGGSGSATTLADTSTNVGTAIITAGAGTLVANNYDFTTLVNGTLTINRAHLTVTAGDNVRLYGEANPTLSTSLTGFVNGESALTAAGFSGSGSATTVAGTSTNVGTAIIAAGAGTLAATNYDFTNLVNGALTINPAQLSLSSNAASRTYDATTNANVTFGALVGLVGSETLGVTATGAFDDKDVGTGKDVSVVYTLSDGASGGLASNYRLADASLSADITAANLAVTGVTVDDKVYDGTTAATLGGTAVVSPLGADMVSVGIGSGVFDNQNVGADKAVTASGFTLSGADAGNYIIAQPSGLTADITPLITTLPPTPETPITPETPETPVTPVSPLTPPTLPPTTLPDTPPTIPPRALLDGVAQLEADVLKSGSTPSEEIDLVPATTEDARACTSDSSDYRDCLVVSIGGPSGPRLRIVNGGLRLPVTSPINRAKRVNE